MNFTPLGDRILFERVELEQISSGGLILAGMSDDEQNDIGFGQVVAVGEGKFYPETGFITPKAKIGDIIVFNDRLPLKFLHGVYKYEVISESNVLMIVSGEDVKPVAVGTYNKSKEEIAGKTAKWLG